jgi:hypothetical protein
MSFIVKLLSEVVSQVVVFLVNASPERVSTAPLHQSQLRMAHAETLLLALVHVRPLVLRGG